MIDAPILLPKPTLQQVAQVFPLSRQRVIYVCDSSGLRVEQLIRQTAPAAHVVGAGTTLLTCAIGELAARGRVPLFRFRGELAFMEDKLPDPGAAAAPGRAGRNPDAVRRAAAVLIALELAQHQSDNEHARQHRAHYATRIEAYLDQGTEKIIKLLDAARLDSFDFVPRDFQTHAREGAASGAAIIAFPPVRRRRIDKVRAFLSSAVEWQAPALEPFDPKRVEAWVDELRATGAPYLVGTDRLFERHAPVAAYDKPMSRKSYLYASEHTGTAYLSAGCNVDAFAYEPVEVEQLTERSVVQLVPTTGQRMAFLKERYLARGIDHQAAHMNVLVLLDGRLAGGFAYHRHEQHVDRLFLICDFAVARGRRLSKLVALLAVSRLPVAAFERKIAQRITTVETTAYTTRPVSMKYRGVMHPVSRKDTHIQYEGTVIERTPQEVYRDWFDHHGRDAA